MSFTEVSSCVISGVQVKKLKSNSTGLVVCIAQVEGPLVNGYFCLATEAHDHDGLPHTLEHLVFMGSEDYPYKGVLDLLANRCLAQGTNAWTDVDHTCYTVTTAGSEGFLNLLPIYLEHILYPTLTDSAYTTEVHHINKDADDAGVVYCEMQARENTSESLTIFELLQEMYPGRCGYKSETGGLMKNLRESTSNKKVRDYHQSYYRPDNLCLIVTGQVEPDELFKSIQPFEEKIISKGVLPPLTRPWQMPVPPLTTTITKDVLFPTDEEDEGMARVAWRGPSALDRYGMTSVGVLMEYLAETSVAPIQRELVEIEDPFCSEVEQTIIENLETLIGFTLQGVPVDKLGPAVDKVLEVLAGIAQGREAIDEDRMSTIIKRQILNIHNQVEEVPHEFLAFMIIGDFLFSRTSDEFSMFLNQEPRLQQLLKEPISFWVKMVAQYFVDAPHVTVCGRPSADLADRIVTEEKERIGKRKKELRETGLKEKAELVEKSCEQNEIPPPSDIVSALAVPSTDSITFHPLKVLANYMPADKLAGFQEHKTMSVDQIPFLFQLIHIHSGFVQLTAILDTAVLSKELRFYVPLFLELLFESPVLMNGELVPYETVVNQLVADTVQYGADLGFSGGRFSPGPFSQAVFVSVKVESDKYARGVQWLKDVLFNVQFTKERLLVVANKMINDVSRLKREGRHIARTLLWKMLYSTSSNHNLSNMVTQFDFLTSLVAKLKDAAAVKEVIGTMTTVRDKLVAPDNIRVTMGTNVNNVTNPLEPWMNFTSTNSSLPPSKLPSILPSRELLDSSSVAKVTVVGVAGVESNYLLQSTRCVNSFEHPDLPAIMVFIEYLCALEGPMWRQIRGMGLSYHYSMRCTPENGQLVFNLLKSSQLVEAYKVARQIMDEFVGGTKPFEQVQLESAISGVVYEIIQSEKTVADAEQEAILNYLKQRDQSYSRKLLTAVSHVTLDDLKRVGGLYFKKLFDPAETTTAICCNSNKVKEVKMGLEKCGLKVACMADLAQLSVV